MKKEKALYLNLILFHVGIGFVVFLFPFVSKIYGYAILIFGAYVLIPFLYSMFLLEIHLTKE